jgi:hypothetical protein
MDPATTLKVSHDISQELQDTLERLPGIDRALFVPARVPLRKAVADVALILHARTQRSRRP